MTGSWRYKLSAEWQLDKVEQDNPEDKWIRSIDGETDDDPKFDAHELIASSLSTIEARVVQLHLYEGKTFREIGDITGYSRQNAYRIYKVSLDKLKGALSTTDDEV